MGDAKTATHKSGIAKDIFQPNGVSVSYNIKIAGNPAQKEISYSTTAKIGKVSSAVKSVENFEGLLTHLFSGDRVFVTADDVWCHGVL
jgi:hypothetical protein